MRKANVPFFTSPFSCLTVLLYKDIGLGYALLVPLVFHNLPSLYPLHLKKLYLGSRANDHGHSPSTENIITHMMRNTLVIDIIV